MVIACGSVLNDSYQVTQLKRWKRCLQPVTRRRTSSAARGARYWCSFRVDSGRLPTCSKIQTLASARPCRHMHLAVSGYIAADIRGSNPSRSYIQWQISSKPTARTTIPSIRCWFRSTFSIWAPERVPLDLRPSALTKFLTMP